MNHTAMGYVCPLFGHNFKKTKTKIQKDDLLKLLFCQLNKTDFYLNVAKQTTNGMLLLRMLWPLFLSVHAVSIPDQIHFVS